MLVYFSIQYNLPVSVVTNLSTMVSYLMHITIMDLSCV